MKPQLLLAVFYVFSMSDSFCEAQLTSEQLRNIQRNQRQIAEYAERLAKAEKSGVSLFGSEPQDNPEVPPDIRKGTIFAKTPPEFEVGDWGHTSQIFEVVSIVSPTELLVLPIYKDAEPMLLRGLNTEKVTDGVEFVLPRAFVILGTYKYMTTSGASKTVLVLDITRANERLKEAVAAADKERLAAEDALYSKWIVENEEVIAKYGGYAKGKVILIRKNDSTAVEVPISSLGKSNQDWVRQDLRRIAEAKAAREKAAKLEKAKRSRAK